MSKKIKDENGNVYVKKTPFYKKWWFILLVVLIAYGAVTKGGGSITSKNSTGNSTTTQTTSSTEQATNDKNGKTAVSEESKSAEKKSVAQAIPKIGEVTKVGDVEYIVNSKSISQNVGGEYGKTANGSYLILNVTVKNSGKKSITVTNDFFKLLKGDTEYETDSVAG
ncbi:MAG: hypothetical protein Q616_SPPC00830G0002, partial [Streptococcus parasanguinis DORA_23_24]